MKVRQNDLIKNKQLLHDIDQKYKKANFSSSSLLRMFSIYWGSTPVKLTENKRSTGINQSSVSDSVK